MSGDQSVEETDMSSSGPEWRGRRLGGCLFEASPPPAPQLEMLRADAPPPVVDLRALCSPVENQGQVGSCAANAMVGALEYHQRRNRAPLIDLSRLYVYYNARQMAGNENEDTGTFISHVMASVMAHGACEERVWPYIESQWPVRPTPAAYANAQNFSAVQYARVPLGPACLHAVASGLPVVFGVMLPSSYYDEANVTGQMPVPGANAPPPGGGHAMLIVGYDLAAETWLVRNSWGAEVFDGGYLRIPFATMKHYAHPDQFWTIGAIDQLMSSAMRLSGPSQQQAAQATRAAAPRDAVDALAVLKRGLREKLNTDLDAAKKGFRDRLRGPGAGGGY
jgi:C1A family cysteine protease